MHGGAALLRLDFCGVRNLAAFLRLVGLRRRPRGALFFGGTMPFGLLSFGGCLRRALLLRGSMFSGVASSLFGGTLRIHREGLGFGPGRVRSGASLFRLGRFGNRARRSLFLGQPCVVSRSGGLFGNPLLIERPGLDLTGRSFSRSAHLLGARRFF